MANLAKWGNLASVVSLLTTELNSLANGAATAASSAIANQTNLDVYADIELVLASLSPVAPNYGTLYILAAIDGTNYPSATAATAQRIVVRHVLLPPATFKVVYYNQAGVALNATGNTIKAITYGLNLNA